MCSIFWHSIAETTLIFNRIIRTIQPQSNFTFGELPLAAALAAANTASERRSLSVPHSHSESCLRTEERAFLTRQLPTVANSHACSPAR